MSKHTSNTIRNFIAGTLLIVSFLLLPLYQAAGANGTMPYEEAYSSRFGAGGATSGTIDFSDLGIHWTRLPIDVDKNFQSISASIYNNMDASVQKLHALNIVPYGLVSVSLMSQSPAPTPDEFGQAVSALVSRYSTGDYPIKVWEFINEYTTQMYTNIDLNTYIQMMAKAIQATKAACPDCLIAFNPHVKDNAKTLLQTISVEDIDIISLHTYSPLDFPDLTDPIASQFYILNVRSYLQDLGLQNKPIWATEYDMNRHQGSSASANPGNPGHPIYTPGGDQTDNARWLMQTTAYGFGTGLFEKIIYTELSDGTNQIIDWISLIDPTTKSKKQVYYALKKLASLTDGFSSATQLYPGSNLYGFKFSLPGKNVYILWSKEGTPAQSGIVLSGINAGQVTVTPAVPDATGNFTSSTMNVTNGQMSLNLDNTPLYIEEAVTSATTTIAATSSTTTTAIQPTTTSSASSTTTAAPATTTIPPCALAQSLENKRDVETLRVFRSLLLTNSTGSFLASIYYQNSAEISLILEEDQELRERLQHLVGRNMEKVQQRISTGRVDVSAEAADEAIAFLNEIKKNGSPKLQSAVDMVVRWIEDGYLLNELDLEAK